LSLKLVLEKGSIVSQEPENLLPCGCRDMAASATRDTAIPFAAKRVPAAVTALANDL
jgi:hypothetical protein